MRSRIISPPLYRDVRDPGNGLSMSCDIAMEIVLSAIQQPASGNAIQVVYCYDEVVDGALFPDCILKPRQKEYRAVFFLPSLCK